MKKGNTPYAEAEFQIEKKNRIPKNRLTMLCTHFAQYVPYNENDCLKFLSFSFIPFSFD